MVEYKEFGVLTLEQVANEGAGDVAMRSIAARRPTIFGQDTYVIGNVIGGILVGAVLPELLKFSGQTKTAAEIVGAGMFAKGLVQFAKSMSAPSVGLVRSISVPTSTYNHAMAVGPAMF